MVICEDNLLGNKYVKQTLLHELVHAYDQCRAKVNWKSCYHIACTEVRLGWDDEPLSCEKDVSETSYPSSTADSGFDFEWGV